MGNAINSPSLFTERALAENEVTDAIAIQFDESVLLDSFLLSCVYAYGLSTGVVGTKNDHLFKKRENMKRKIVDIDSVLHVMSLGSQLNCERNPHHSKIIDQFRRKKMKYIQREIGFLTQNLDSFQWILESRVQMLFRNHIAFIRMQKREELFNERVLDNLEEKVAFIQGILTSSESDFKLDANFIENVCKLAKHLPEVSGLVGLSGRISKDELIRLKSKSQKLNEFGNAQNRMEEDLNQLLQSDFLQDMDIRSNILESLQFGGGAPLRPRQIGQRNLFRFQRGSGRGGRGGGRGGRGFDFLLREINALEYDQENDEDDVSGESDVAASALDYMQDLSNEPIRINSDIPIEPVGINSGVSVENVEVDGGVFPEIVPSIERKNDESEEPSQPSQPSQPPKPKKVGPKYSVSGNNKYFHNKEMLFLVFEHTEKATIKALDAIKSLKGSEEDKNIPLGFKGIYPTSKLLNLLQRDLLHKVLMIKNVNIPEKKKVESKEKEKKTQDENDDSNVDENNRLIKTFCEYGTSLILGCSNVLDRAKKISKEKGRFKLDCHVLRILYNSFFGEILPTFLTAIYECVYLETLPDFAMRMFGCLKKLLVSLDDVSSLIEGTKIQEVKALGENAENCLHPVNIVIVESPHTYFPTNEEKVISIPGSSHLVLEFDPRCETERGRDYLDLSTIGGVPLHDRISGDSNFWPRLPIVVNGDKFILKFNADTNSAHWGYSIKVFGFKHISLTNTEEQEKLLADNPPYLSPFFYKKMFSDEKNSIIPDNIKNAISDIIKAKLAEPKKKKKDEKEKKDGVDEDESELEIREVKNMDEPPSNFKSCWILEILNTASRVFGRCAKKAIIGHRVSDEEKQFSRWLCSPIFSSGFDSEHSFEMKNIPSSKEPMIISELDDESEEKAFLDELIESKTDSLGMKLDDTISKLIPKSFIQIQKVGGEVVMKTVKYFIAVLLKHLGLLENAILYIKEGTDDSIELEDKFKLSIEQSLKSVWVKGQQFHQWIVSGFSSFVTLHHAKLNEYEEMKQPFPENEKKEAEKKLNYEGYCEDIIEKAKFLLILKPCVMNTSSADVDVPRLELSLNVNETLELARANSSSKTHDSLKSVRSLFNVYTTLQHWSVYKENQRKLKTSGSQSSISDLIVQFFQNSFKVHKFKKFIEIHMNRALLRASTIDAVKDMLEPETGLKHQSAKIGILSSWGPPFRTYLHYSAQNFEDEGPSGGHYLKNIESCGPHLRKQVSVSFSNLYMLLANLIKDPDTDPILKVLSINSWCVDFIPLDHQFILKTKVLTELEKLSKKSDDNNELSKNILPNISKLTTKLLSLVCVDFEIDETVPLQLNRSFSGADILMKKVKLDKLQSLVFGKTVEEVKSFLNKMRATLEKVRQAIKEHSIEDHDVFFHEKSKDDVSLLLLFEKRCYDALCSLCTNSSSKSVLDHISSPLIFKVFFRILYEGSPRMKGVVIRSLTAILPSLDPVVIDKWNLMGSLFNSEQEFKGCFVPGVVSSPTEEDKKDFIHYCFSIIGSCLNVIPNPEREERDKKEYELLLKKVTDKQSSVDLEIKEKDNSGLDFILNSISPLSYQNGEVNLDLGAQYITLIRSLAASKTKWRMKIMELAGKSLKNLSNFVKQNSIIIKEYNPSSQEFLRDIRHALAALALAGGYTDRFRLGGRVETIRKNEQTSFVGSMQTDVSNHNNNEEKSEGKEEPLQLMRSISQSSNQSVNEGPATGSLVLNETGTIVQLDPTAGQCKVLFDHNSNRVVECDLAKIRVIDEVPPIEFSALLRAASKKHLVDVFQSFSSLTEEEYEESVKKRSEEMKRRQLEEEKERKSKLKKEKMKQKQKEKENQVYNEEEMVLVEPWNCGVCTFLNQPQLKACEICGSPCPFIVQQEVGTSSSPLIENDNEKLEEEGDEEEEEDYEVPPPFVSGSRLIFHQLRSRCIRLICKVLESNVPENINFLLENKVFEPLLKLSVHPTDGKGFVSVGMLENMEERLIELLQQSFFGEKMIDDSVKYKHDKKVNLLEFSPFKSHKVNLPSAFDIGSARGIQFIDDKPLEVMCLSDNSGYIGGLVRTNYLVPNSLPGFYFEMEVLSVGSDDEPSKDEKEEIKESDFQVAIGLLRSGMSMDGCPGSHNSYAYSIANGMLHCTENTVPLNMEFSSGGKKGDIVGCGWDLRKRQIFFTRNGMLVCRRNMQGDYIAFENVSGRFYPAIWVQKNGVHISGNFGQKEYAFDVKTVFPNSYFEGEGGKKGNATERTLTEAEMKRASMVEELVVMMGGAFPRLICEIALEQSGDNIFVAADLLINEGARELQKMENAALEASRKEDDERKRKELGDVEEDEDGSDSEAEDLEEWLNNEGNNEQQDGRRRNAANYLDDEIEEDLPVGIERREIDNARRAGGLVPNQNNANADANAAEERLQSENGHVYESLKIDDIVQGQLLTVNESWGSIVEGMKSLKIEKRGVKGETHPSVVRNALRSIISRTGVVTAVDVNKCVIRMMFFDPLTAVKHFVWCPLHVLVSPHRLKIDPCSKMKGFTFQQLSSLFSDTEQILTIRRVRLSILKMVSSIVWNVNSNSIYDNESNKNKMKNNQQLPGEQIFSLLHSRTEIVVDLLKLAGAEFLSTKLKGRSINKEGNHVIMDGFKTKLQSFVLKEVENNEKQKESDNNNKLEDLRFTEEHYKKYFLENDNPSEHSNKEKKTEEGDSVYEKYKELLDSKSASPMTELTQRIVEESIVHLVQATKNPPPVLTFKSRHPFESYLDVRLKAYIPGASKLLVTFDPRCRLSEDMVTRLAFYRDEDYQDLINTFSNRNNNGGWRRNQWQPFIVPGNCFWFRFTSGINSENWGYKFKVRPLELRIDDTMALRSLNFELGSWIFSFLLSSTPNVVKYSYIVDIYDAIVWYVVNSKPSAKSRGVTLLVQFLLYMHKIYNEDPEFRSYKNPDFEKLKPLSNVMDVVEEGKIEVQMQSPTVQSLVELLATADLVKKLQTRHQRDSGNLIKLNEYDEKEVETKGNDNDQMRKVSLESLNSNRMRILTAKMYLTSEPNKKYDITKGLDELLKRNGEATILIPSYDGSSKEWIPGFSFSDGIGKGAQNKSWSFEIEYQIYTVAFQPETKAFCNVVLKEMKKTVSSVPNKALIIKPSLSIFDKVVEISRLTLDMESSGKLPSDFLLEAYRVSQLYKNFYTVINEKGVDISSPKDCYMVPDHRVYGNLSAVRGEEVCFSLCFWLYLAEYPSNSVRSLMYKGTQFSLQIETTKKLSFLVTTPTSLLMKVSTKNNVPIKTWCFVSCVCSRKEFAIYLNGDKAHGVIDGPSLSSSDVFVVGKNLGTEMNSENKFSPIIDGFEGKVADCRYYFYELSEKMMKSIRKEHKKVMKKSIRDSPFASLPINEICLDKNVLNMIQADNNNDNIKGQKKNVQYSKNNSASLNYWSHEKDRDLIDLFSILAKEEKKAEVNLNRAPSLMHINPWTYDDAKLGSLLEGFPHLNNLKSMDNIRIRFSTLKLLNMKVSAIIPVVDFSQASCSWSLAHRLSTLSPLIFFEIKNRSWARILRQTSSNGRGHCHVVVNRPRAAKAREKGDPDGRKSVFGQIYRQLHFVRPSLLRTENRPWSVTYEGEGGQDAGGLFRDSLSHVCADLQSKSVPLFIPCPNAKGFGNNQEKWVPNPACSSSLHLSMYAFVGKLMGMSIRGRHVLNLDFPSIVWKPLVGQAITRDDIEDIDSLCFNVLDKIANSETHNITEETFKSAISATTNFETVSMDGRSIELVENGKNIPVEWNNRHEFVRLVEQYKIDECTHQVNAIRRGLATIVPIQLLNLFTWSELEKMVCGDRKIDIEYLKLNTRYRHPISQKDKHIKYFWEALSDFNDEQRQNFLRFVWGQSRLPYDPADFTQKFEILQSRKNDDLTLPVSHTCFFSIELPKYSSVKVMKDKLLYASYNCWAIDTDHAAQNVDWDDES